MQQDASPRSGILRDLQRSAGNGAVVAALAVMRQGRQPARPATSGGTVHTVATPPGVHTTSQVLEWRLVGGGKHRTRSGEVETGPSRLVMRIRKGKPTHPLGIGQIHAGAEFNVVRLDVSGGGTLTFHDAKVMMYDATSGERTPEVTLVFSRMERRP